MMKTTKTIEIKQKRQKFDCCFWLPVRTESGNYEDSLQLHYALPFAPFHGLIIVDQEPKRREGLKETFEHLRITINTNNKIVWYVDLNQFYVWLDEVVIEDDEIPAWTEKQNAVGWR